MRVLSLGEFRVRHARIAPALRVLTECALGCVTHFLQQQLHRGHFLLLHVSAWWVLMTLPLLHLAERANCADAGPFPYGCIDIGSTWDKGL